MGRGNIVMNKAVQRKQITCHSSSVLDTVEGSIEIKDVTLQVVITGFFRIVDVKYTEELRNTARTGS
jgi:hypothetical protein